MSQGSQGSFAADRIVLPLSKFSYATVHGESTTPIPWIHLGTTNNLFAIFETRRLQDGAGQTKDLRKFKVLQDPDFLEDIDLDVLASEATRAEAEAQDPRRSGKAPSVAVIVKVPCIAARYPLQGGQIRRIQIRLASDEDYYETLKILSRANIPFADAGSFPSQQQPARPFSSSSSLLRPSDSASQLGARPVSVSSNLGELSSVRAGSSAGWVPSSFLRPTTSSGPVGGSLSGTVSNYFGQSPGVTDSSRMPFNEVPTLDKSPNGFVSGYFAGQNHSHSIYPTPGSAPGYVSSHGPIDLYLPRPSTAPFLESQNLSQMLPPKRELPFSNPTPAKRARKGSTKTGGTRTDADLVKLGPPSSLPDFSDSRAKFVPAMENASQVSTQSAATVPTTKEKRVAASRAPKPRATTKQPANAPARKSSKAGSKAAKENSLVPSIEQLLEQTQNHSKHTLETAPIETQALITRAEATRPYQSIELRNLSKGPDSRSELSAPSSQTRKCTSCRLRKGKCNGEDPCDWCTDINVNCSYDTPAEMVLQVLVPSSQPESAADVSTKVPSPDNGNAIALPPRESASRRETLVPEAVDEDAATLPSPTMQESPTQAPKPPNTPQVHPTDPDGTLINAACARPNTDTTLAQESLHLSAGPSPLALLLREPLFAPSDQLASWANLSDSVQRRTLDTWMCQQLSDPAFTALVRRIDESWQAMLFGRSVGVEL